MHSVCDFVFKFEIVCRTGIEVDHDASVSIFFYEDFVIVAVLIIQQQVKANDAIHLFTRFCIKTIERKMSVSVEFMSVVLYCKQPHDKIDI